MSADLIAAIKFGFMVDNGVSHKVVYGSSPLNALQIMDEVEPNPISYLALLEQHPDGSWHTELYPELGGLEAWLLCLADGAIKELESLDRQCVLSKLRTTYIHVRTGFEPWTLYDDHYKVAGRHIAEWRKSLDANTTDGALLLCNLVIVETALAWGNLTHRLVKCAKLIEGPEEVENAEARIQQCLLNKDVNLGSFLEMWRRAKNEVLGKRS